MISADGVDEATTVPEPTGPSPFARVWLTFTAPSRAFRNLTAASWWAPYVVLLLFGLGFAAIVGSQVGWNTVARNALAASPKQQARIDQLPADQQAAQVAMVGRITRISVYVGNIVAPLIIAAIVAGLLLATFNFVFAGNARYGSLFSLYLFSSLPQVLKLILVYILLFAGGAGESFNINNPVGSNVAYYLQGSNTPHWLMAIFTWVDVFIIWQIVLLIIGGAMLARISRGKAATAVCCWVLLFILITAGFASLS